MRVCLLGALILLASSISPAFVVTGQVRDGAMAPVNGVDVDLVNRSTDVSIPLTGDTSDAAGAFTLPSVPAGNYDIFYAPPDAAGLAGGQQLNVTISGDTALPSISLQPGFELRMQAVTYYGAPVAGVNLDVYDPMNVKLFTVHDTSNTSGVISTFVPQGGSLYRMVLVDAGGHGYPPKEFYNVQILSNTDLGPVVIGPSRSVSGRTLRYSDSLPISAVDVDFVDSCGLTLKVSGDLTDAGGNFVATGVVDGYYDVYFRPTGLDRKVFKRVGIHAPLAFGDVKLGTLRTVTGTVVNASDLPLAGIDLDFTDQSQSLQVLLNNDNTLANGTFSTQATDGIYTIEFRPPAGSPYAPRTMFDVLLTANLNLGNVVLQNAVFLQGYVRRRDNTPVANARIQAFDTPGGREVFVTGNRTDANGFYHAGFAAGTYTLMYSPAPGDDSLRPATFAGEVINATRQKDVILPTPTAAADWQMYQ